ncbi:MAG TPA: DUF308 domain-containing protein [Anaerolineales bacterium]|nr:DUF308 domain-containing protein [Anaerolineales bacterium]
MTASMDMSAATQMDTKPHPMWKTLITGIAAVVIGGVLLWAPAKAKVETYTLIVALLGFWWLIAGVLDIVHIFTDRTAWGWKLFMGIISIVAGAYILMYPIAAAVALPRVFVFVLGFWGLFYGIVLLINAFRGAGWGAGILGVLAIIFGGMLIGSYTMPGSGLAFLWSAAIVAVIGGIALIVQSFRTRTA